MSDTIELLQGTLDVLILKAVSLGPLHGYGVLLRIQQISQNRLQIQQGSLYPALYRLEHQGLIASEWGESENKRKAKYLPPHRGRPAATQGRDGVLAAVLGGDRVRARSDAGGRMSLIARVRSWLRVSSRRADFEREMQDEMRIHLELYQADLRRRGVPEEEARRRALAEFGSVGARQEECRDAVGLRLVDELRGDVSYAFRLLRRSPAFTLVALLSLGLGIGANTAIFSLIDTVLVKTLPVDDPQRLFFVDNSGGKSGGSSGPPYPCFELLRDHNRFLSGIAAFSQRMFKVSIDGVPERVRGQYASGSYFDLLGVRAAHGRLLTPADDSEPGRGGPRRRGGRHQRRLLDAPLRTRSGSAREERSGRHAVGDDRRGHTARILRAPGRHAARHHAAHDARRTGSAIEAELVAERDRASLRPVRRPSRRGRTSKRCGTAT